MVLQRRSAFTLIELLVVIAILSLLASILFPVFGRARENARRTSCVSNLRQIGLGVMQYAQDYDETLPLYSYNGSIGYNGADGPRWADLIYPYVKSAQLFDCPSATIKMKKLQGGQYFDADTYSYSLISPTTNPIVGVAERKLASLEETTTTLMVVDDGRLDPSGEGTAETRARLLPIVGETIQALGARLDGFRHTGCGPADFNSYAFNALYADGHVKWERLSDAWDGGKMRQWTITGD